VRRAGIGVAILVVLLCALDAAVVWSSPAAGDWYQFYWAGHIVATGGSPYDPNEWTPAARGPEIVGGAINIVRGNCRSLDTPECLWLYPPWAALIFAPFGALPADIGIALLRLSLIVTGGIAALMVVRETALRSAMPLAAAVALTSQPLLLATRTGHFDALAVIGALLLRRGLDGSTRWLVPGVLLLSLKPHLALVLFVVTAALLLRRGRARALGTTMAIVGAVAAVSLARYPLPPLSTLLAEAAGRTEFGSPTTWLLARTMGGDAWPLVAIGIVAAGAWCAAVAARATVGLRDGAPVAAALGLSLVVAPYEHVHDHTLLLSAATLAIAAAFRITRRRTRAAALAIAAAAGVYPWFAFFWGLGTMSALPSAFVPLFVLGAFALAVALARPAAVSSSPPTGSSP
jgi:hypothetical protein